MTVCVAALSDDGKGAVLVTDKMLTLPGLSYQVEKPSYKKDYKVGDCYILISGDTANAYEVVTLAQEKLKLFCKNSPMEKADIKELIRQSYQEFRRKVVIQRFIEPRGLDLASYYSGRIGLPPQVVMEIENNLQNFNINLEMIIVCKNPSNNYSLYYLIHPGELRCADPIGYISIGCGAIHSLYYLTGSDYSRDKSMDKVEQILRKAKEQAEKSPGVGKETTLIRLEEKQEDKQC